MLMPPMSCKDGDGDDDKNENVVIGDENHNNFDDGNDVDVKGQ